MAISIASKIDGNHFIIALDGRLDHYALKQFCDAYEAAPAQTTLFVVDLEKLKALDSSGLGMLLLLHSHAGGQQDRVRLVNASPTILKLLHIAKYEDLFEID